jgi:hypothetical protein
MDEHVRFCNNCDYAIEREQLRHFRVDLPCPRCGKENLVGNVYKLGSKEHFQRRRLWELGEVKGAPMPFK